MTSKSWSVASAKAELSRVMRRARKCPQIIESRGEPVAVVLGVRDYERVAEQVAGVHRWRSLLAASAAIRGDGGATLELPSRRARRSPFARTGR